MKVRLLVPKKKIKHNMMKFKIDISKPLLVDTDKDGLPDIYDCAPRNPRKKDLGHLISGHRAKKELKVAKEMDLPIDEEYETELKEAISKGDKEKKRIIENIRAGFKDTDKNFSGIARGYTRRAEHAPKQQKPQQMTRGVYYLIPSSIACRKMFHDAETGEPSSIPKFKRDVYKPYSPSFASGMFTPQRAPNPSWLVKKQRERELIRLYLRLKSREGIE